MRVTIPHFVSFKMKFTTDREKILKAKIEHLRKYDYTEVTYQGNSYLGRA